MYNMHIVKIAKNSPILYLKNFPQDTPIKIKKAERIGYLTESPTSGFFYRMHF